MSLCFSYVFTHGQGSTAAQGCTRGRRGDAEALGAQDWSPGSGLLAALRDTAARVGEKKAATGKEKLHISLQKKSTGHKK